MSTQTQFAANLQNARLSTGPRTEEGKAKSRLNGLKHGLTGIMRLLADEAQDEYAANCEGIVDALRPEGALELRIAQSIADDYWRIDRLRRAEQTLFNHALRHTMYNDSPYHPEHSALHAVVDNGKAMERFTLYENRLNRNIRNNTADLQKLQAARPVAEPASVATPAESPTTNESSNIQKIGFAFANSDLASSMSLMEAHFRDLGGFDDEANPESSASPHKKAA